MGQILVRNVPDATLAAYRERAKAKGHSLEQEIRDLLDAHRQPSREELVEALRKIRDMTPLSRSLTLDEIREGLE
jgi:antitoxin FitA